MELSDKALALLERGIGAAVILILGLILIKIILKITRKALTRTTLDASVYKFIISAAKIALYIILIVILLTQLNVPPAPLVTVLGACGAAIALALKDSLGNIAGGILLLVNEPFRKGDVIDVAGTNGIVEHIDLFVTTLKTFDNKVITIPNGSITTSVLVNYSKEEKRRVDLVFGIGYNSDIGKAKDVLAKVADSNPNILKEPAPIIGVASQLDSAVALDLKVWCSNDKYYEVKYYLTENVKLAFDEANISIPYPQMDVHVVK